MHSLYTCEQTRKIDQLAIQEGKIPGVVLMKRAGRAAFELIKGRWPGRRLIVFCGGGNNGGDGYIVAALAKQQHIEVEVFSTVPLDQLSGDALKAKDFAVQEGVVIQAVADAQLDIENTVIVDGILGTGFNGELRDTLRGMCQRINHSKSPVVALDIPSGLEGDTGHADSDAIRAELTITFVGRKRGLFTGRGPALCGDIQFEDLGIPAELYQSVSSSIACVNRIQSIPKREADAHKQDSGHVLVIGGESGMGGAAILAAEAALRCGAGLVSLATRPEHVPAILARIPEVMAKGVNAGPELEPLIQKADVIVIGPGLGQSAWSQQLLYFALQSGLPMVVDADALNIIAQGLLQVETLPNTVITPHPGEAARLLSSNSAFVQADRFASVTRLQQKFDCVALLKGAGTLVCDEHTTSIAQVGNAGMAVAGMGDVLSGVIGALLAQGLPVNDAAINGVCLHGLAGDRAAQGGTIGLRASDLMPHLRNVLNQALDTARE